MLSQLTPTPSNQLKQMTFSPNMVTRLVTSLAVLPILISPAPAKAEVGQINGYRANVIDSGSYDVPDSLTVWGPEGVETITVTCAPFDWSSFGPNTTVFANSIANEWCF